MEQPNNLEQKFTPEPAESFGIEFLNARGKEIKDAMLKMGFQFRGSGPDGEDNVYFEGERSDDTRIRIIIEKGNGYKSPAEIAEEEKEN